MLCVDGGHGPGCPNYRHPDCNAADARLRRTSDSLFAMTVVAIIELVAIIGAVIRFGA